MSDDEREYSALTGEGRRSVELGVGQEEAAQGLGHEVELDLSTVHHAWAGALPKPFERGPNRKQIAGWSVDTTTGLVSAGWRPCPTPRPRLGRWHYIDGPLSAQRRPSRTMAFRVTRSLRMHPWRILPSVISTPQLTLARLWRSLPLAWPDQRRALGFSSVPIAPG